MSRIKIDDIDRKILKVLQKNAKIARQVNLVSSATLERVKRLEKLKVTKGYHACVDPIAMDLKFLWHLFI